MLYTEAFKGTAYLYVRESFSCEANVLFAVGGVTSLFYFSVDNTNKPTRTHKHKCKCAIAGQKPTFRTI